MNRKCFMLQAKNYFTFDLECRLFSTRKKANDFFYQYCVGAGIVHEVRCVNNRRFYEGIIVSMKDVKGV